MPPNLQQEVHAIVVQTRTRSGWPATRTLLALGVSRRSYYRWLKEEAWSKAVPVAKPVQPYEALPAEKAAVLELFCFIRSGTNRDHSVETVSIAGNGNLG